MTTNHTETPVSAVDGNAPAGRKPPIVLVHGLWMTPASWDTWATRFRAAGHEVITPGWPGIDDRSVADVRANPEPLKGIGLKRIADHYERIIRALPTKPIIMGHSTGGVIVQMLADRDLGAAYVGVSSAQPAGISTLPLATIRTSTPILSNPFGRNGARPISRRQFHFTFANDLPRAKSDELWERYAVPSYNRAFFELVAATLNEKGGASHVDFAKPDRAPLLIVAAEIDHAVPPAVGKAIVKRYRAGGSPAVVEYKEFPGRTHRIVSQDGWEEVADYALTWAVEHAQAQRPAVTG